MSGLAVQRYGAMVQLQGPLVKSVYYVLQMGIRDTQRRDGIAPSRSLLVLMSELQAAIEEMSDGRHDDVAGTAPSRQSVLSPIGTREAAEMLGMSRRQVQRIAASLGGRRAPGLAWVFPRDEVEAYAAARNGQDQ